MTQAKVSAKDNSSNGDKVVPLSFRGQETGMEQNLKKKCKLKFKIKKNVPISMSGIQTSQ